MDKFVIVPAAALGCYLILLLVFLLSRHSKLKKAFIEIMSAYVLWALGSMCMRLKLIPSIGFWFHVSLLGLFLLPAVMLHFTVTYIEEEFTTRHLCLSFGSLFLYAVNLLTGGCFIAPPALVSSGKGAKFVYDIGFMAAIPYLYLCILLGYICWILIRAVRKGLLSRAEFCLFFSGKVLLFLGNVLINVPLFSGFPIDMFSGILDALLMSFVLCFSDRFKQTMTVSKRIYRLLFMISIGMILLCTETSFEHILLNLEEPGITRHITLLVTSTFLIAYFLFCWLNEFVIDHIFLKDRELQIQRLNRFNLQSSRTLDILQIEKLMEETAQELLNTSRVVLCVWDETAHQYHSNAQNKHDITWSFPEDHCLIHYLQNKKEGLHISECLHREKIEPEMNRLLLSLRNNCMAYIQPVFIKERLWAFLLCQDRKKKFSQEEMQYLVSLTSSASIAVQNAELYETAYRDARTDQLTQTGNRKYFYESLSVLNKTQTVSLILLKLDDFRIYNQLYGNLGGDRILKRVAEVITAKAGHVFRYGATEFAVILENKTSAEARNLAEEIRAAIMNITTRMKENEMMVTASLGVYTRENETISDTDMVDKCSLALYMAKRRGKNCTVVYTNDTPGHASKSESNIVHIKDNAFREYAAVFRALTAAIDAKDHYTFGHSENVSYYATELARAYGLNEENIEIVKDAGLLHDIGKIGIPEHILLKPGKLTDEEYQIMKGHVEQSIAILHHLSGMEYVLPAILGHHERYDGYGYPRGIAGEQIPLLARILCIADSFDAMISKRSYKTGYSLDRTISQLQECAGTQFDPQLAPLFIELITSQQIQIRYPEEMTKQDSARSS